MADRHVNIMMVRAGKVVDIGVSTLMAEYSDDNAVQRDGARQFVRKEIQLDGQIVSQQIIDFHFTKSQPYRVMNSSAYHDRDGFVVCVDAADDNVLLAIKDSIQNLQRYVSSSVPVVIVVTKVDKVILSSEKQAEIKEFSQECNLSIEFSSLTDNKANTIFENLTNKILHSKESEKDYVLEQENPKKSSGSKKPLRFKFWKKKGMKTQSSESPEKPDVGHNKK